MSLSTLLRLLRFLPVSLLLGCVGVDHCLVPSERVLDLQFLQSIALLLLFLEQALDARFALRVGLGLKVAVFGTSEHLLGRLELPVSITMLERVPMHFIIVHHVHIELPFV